MSGNYNFSPTLDGLNNIDGDSISCDSIITNDLTVNTSATVPTLGTGDSSNYAASTAYVTNKINSVVGNFVTLNTNQTISSCQKTFNNSNVVFDNINASVPSIEMKGGSTSYLKINASNTGQQVYAKQNLNLFSPSTRIKPDVLATNTNGLLFINDNTAIGELSFKVYDGSVNNEINSSQGLTINPTTTFTNLPTCSSVPSSGSQLTNKTYVDNAVSTGGTNFVTLNTNQTITAPKTFDDIVTTNLQVTFNDTASFQNGAFFDNVCPYSTVAPSGSNDLTRKSYIDSNFVDKTSTQTISGSKTFNALTVNQTAGTDINMTVNNVASDNIYFNFSTSQSLRMRYTNALNRLQMLGTSATREVSLGANNNDYIIIKPATLELILNAPNTLVGGNLNMTSGSGFTFIPVGTINTSVVSTVPTGFLYCNGQAVLRSFYPNLFTAIGTTYGAGDGSTTFNVPNFQGCFLRGSGSQTIGGVSYTAAAVGTAQQDQVLAANYASNEGFRDCGSGTRSCVSRSRITGDPVDTNTGILAQFDRQGTENRPVNHAVYYYIKF